MATTDVKYDGYQLPRDAGKLDKNPQAATTVTYAEKTLPNDKATPVTFSDPFNTPGLILLNNGVQQIQLPPDTVVIPEGEKRLAMTFIVDGPSVFERIQTKPRRLEFRGTFRMQDIGGTRYNNTTPPPGATGWVNNVFPQEYINDVYNYVFLPNTVLTLKNSFLNGIGILELIVENIIFEPRPGTTNVGYSLAAWENQRGQSIIIK